MNFNENYALGGAYLKSKKIAFSFCKIEKRHKNCIAWINREIEKLGENPSVYQGTMACLAVGVAIGLGYLESINCAQGVSSMGMSESVSFYLGWIICCAGLIAGEKLGDGLKNRKINEFTGKPIINSNIVSGVILSIVYLFTQFYISYSAANDSGSSFFIVIYVMLISAFELLVGAIFLKKSIMTIGILLTRIRRKYLLNKMSRLAARVEKLWQLYLYSLSKSSLPVTQAEEVPAIRRAREFHANGGIEDDIFE